MRAVITVIGSDKIGIIAEVTNILAKYSVNILDISQTIMQDVFTMIMLVDLKSSKIPYGTLVEEIAQKEKELGVSIIVQHEDIFNSMHRI